MAKKKKKKVAITRDKSGRRIFLDKMRLWGLIQADDYTQWIAAQVKAQTRHEAVFLLNKYYGYPAQGEKLCGVTLTGTEQDKYLQVVEMGGLTLPQVEAMGYHEVCEVQGLFEWDD